MDVLCFMDLCAIVYDAEIKLSENVSGFSYCI